MIHYHGTPMGGKRDALPSFFRGRHAFVPFPRPEDVGAVAEYCRSFAFDNGAFSVWKRGEQLDVEGYIRFVERWHKHPGFDWAIIPDVIEGTERENDDLISEWPAWLEGVPVWHYHESIERLVLLCANWRTVALGSSGKWPTPGTESWNKRTAEIMDAICDDEGRPPCRLHGLRMLNVDIFTRLPLASADSTNVCQNANLLTRFGMYCPPSVTCRRAGIADRIEFHNSAPCWVRETERQNVMFQ